ncbi:MAG: HDIG domain-containing protein [Deltaproteobacteria bacterium]|nr:HDIG domain-containing protein [Deltaproteobacteria bacterium]
MNHTRDDAWNLLCEWTASESLRRHALGVERVMRALARKHGGDEEAFGLAGLLHDFDYERHPDINEHCKVGAGVLEARGYPAEVVRAVLAHNPVHGVPADTTMARCLVAADELVGFVVACALVRPGKDIGTLEAPSVRKRLKEKRFAASVDRAEIARGVELLGVELDEHVTFIIEALRPIAADLGLTSSR